MKHLLLISLALGAFGCSNTQTETATSKNTAASYASPGKPSAAIELDYQVSKERVAVGETLDISFAFKGKPSAAISAQIEVSPNMSLAGDKELSLTAHKSTGATARQSFSVTPLSEGIHYVNLFANETGKNTNKPFAIRIIAGDKPIEQYLQVNGTLEETSDGEKIISMPAETK